MNQTDDLPTRIIRLADACAALEPALAGRATEVREVVDLYAKARLIRLQ